jgi:hypothetical protein
MSRTVALALTWDGARWPTRSLPPQAKAFLAGKFKKNAPPSRSEMSELLVQDEVKEIRVCWVPWLKGGADVASDPFATLTGRRLGFSPTRIIPFGEVLGMIYRRN